MRNIIGRFYVNILAGLVLGTLLTLPVNTPRAEEDTLPAPQLVTNAWMYIVGYEADPEALKSFLPEGLELHPNNRVVLNMYTDRTGLKHRASGITP